MSTEPATPSSEESALARAAAAFANLRGDDSQVATDAAKAELEEKLQAERDARSEERFVWVVVCVILVDVLWFRNAPNAAIPVVVLVLEILIFFVLARRMGIEKLELLFEGLIHSFGRKGSGS
jgi:hypothetical protein